ncbi:MAG: DUF5018 domain-containing protein [Bacteroidota bacterium]
MKKAGSSIVVLVFLSVLAHAQNLVQNPGFEALTEWDSLWVLSFTDPSSSGAVARANTDYFHGGERCLELSNTNFNRWTYFYSDSIRAPLSFAANKQYVVSGWIKPLQQGKGVSLSICWNGSQNEVVIYSGNPDPITDSDWFPVQDTIIAEANYKDGYLALGMRAGKDRLNSTGRILFDDLSVVRIPDNTEAEILDFSIPGQTRAAVINDMIHTITVEVPRGTDVTALAPDKIALSPGASVTPDTGAVMDFTNPVTYTVTAQDELNKQEWIVTVVFPPSSETEILAFSFPEQTGPAVIDTVLHEVHIEVQYGTLLSNLVPDMKVSSGATVDPSPKTAVDFTSPVVYTVTAEDGTTIQKWNVFVAIAPPSEETDITDFSFESLEVPTVIDTAAHTVSCEVPFGTAVDTLTPVIVVSPGASIHPASGVTADFTDPVAYMVTAQDGVTVREWTVQVAVLLNTETDILSFSFEEQTGPATIDRDRHAIVIEIVKGTDLTTLAPAMELSPGASVDPPAGTPMDFTGDVIYTVTAEDGMTSQEWTVSVTVDPAVSAGGIKEAPLFRAYPNPAHDMLVVDVLVPGQIHILDILGRNVISVDHASGRTLISLTGLEQGVYFVRMAHRDSDQINRIIIR